MSSSPTVRRTPWRGIGVLVCLWCALALAVAIAVHWTGARRRDAALERLRASGEPVLPRDLAGAGATGAAAGAWFEAFAARPATDGEDWVAVPTLGSLVGLGTRRFVFHSGASGSPDLAEVEKAAECSQLLEECAHDVDSFWKRVDSALDEPAVARARRECWARAFRMRVERSSEQARKQALDSCAVAPIDPRAVFEALDAEDKPLPEDHRTDAAAAAVELSCDIARAEALAGNATQALRALEAAFCATRVISELPWSSASLRWRECAGRALSAVRQCVSLCPSDADFSALEAAIAELQPHDRFVRALLGQRALANRLYARRAEGRTVGTKAIDDQPFVTGWIVDLMLARDQAACLELFEERIAAARSPTNGPSAGLVPLTASSTPMIGDVVAPDSRGHVRALDTEIALTQLAILARRSGAGAAVERAKDVFDPFDGRPIKSRLEPDGTLVLWSVGVDGKDDHAPLPSSSKLAGHDDIAAFVTPRTP